MRTAAGSGSRAKQQTSVAKQTVTTDAKAEAVATLRRPRAARTAWWPARAMAAGARCAHRCSCGWPATGYISWRRENNDRFSLIADKTSYKPGETADILIPSPFTQPHWALITVERGGVLSHEVRKIDGNSSVYHLPITAAHVPNVYVTVTLFSPPDGAWQAGRFQSRHSAAGGRARPAIAEDRADAQSRAAQPGQNVSYDLLVTDLSGQPVAAELSLDLVDKAVLSLLPRTPDAIRAAFYHRRELGHYHGQRAIAFGRTLPAAVREGFGAPETRARAGSPSALPTASGGSAGYGSAAPMAAEAPAAAGTAGAGGSGIARGRRSKCGERAGSDHSRAISPTPPTGTRM